MEPRRHCCGPPLAIAPSSNSPNWSVSVQAMMWRTHLGNSTVRNCCFIEINVRGHFIDGLPSWHPVQSNRNTILNPTHSPSQTNTAHIFSNAENPNCENYSDAFYGQTLDGMKQIQELTFSTGIYIPKTYSSFLASRSGRDGSISMLQRRFPL